MTQLRPALEEEGEVYLYLQPLPQEAERLKFTIENIFAVNADGREISLGRSLQELKGPDVRRQRLLAQGALPPGQYTGFSFKVKDAILRTEEGDAALLVPEGPSESTFPSESTEKRVWSYPWNSNIMNRSRGKSILLPHFLLSSRQNL